MYSEETLLQPPKWLWFLICLPYKYFVTIKRSGHSESFADCCINIKDNSFGEIISTNFHPARKPAWHLTSDLW